MNLIEVTDLHDPRLADFTRLTDVELRKSTESAHGLYLAESHKVIARAIEAGHRPRAVLALRDWLPKLEPLLSRVPEVPVFVGESDTLTALTGFHLHRGAIASMERPPERDWREIAARARRLVILEDLADHTNVGAIFRSVAALGADGVLLTPACADPLYRRAVRVSMAAVLSVPWARMPDWKFAEPHLRTDEFEIAALALRDDAEPLEHFVSHLPERLAVVFGTEGRGLSRRALRSATRTVSIQMDHGIDSLNVATSAAVVLWAIRAADHGSFDAFSHRKSGGVA